MALSVQTRSNSIPFLQQDQQEEPPNNQMIQREAEASLVKELKDRTRHLELGLKDEKLKHGATKKQHEQELFAERQYCAKLEEELVQMRERDKANTAALLEKDAQLNQKDQIIRANREEIDALSRLALQSNARVNVLEQQMSEFRSEMMQMARQTNELQRQHLSDQRELQLERQRRRHVEPVFLIDKFFVLIRDTISGKTPKEETYG